jgi:putative flippase GtrA
MQILIYFFIGFLSLLLNLSIFSLTFPLTGTTLSIVGAFMIAAVFNYLLCVSLLFRHKARWDTFGEAALYVISVALMGLVDYGVTLGLMALSWSPGYSKFWAAVTGFVGNFIVRKYLVFPEKRRVR